jgi:hypothetical protein
MWNAIVHSIFGDKNKGWQREFRCPYFLCPSNQPFVGAYTPKMKFIQKLSPGAYQYRCKDCGCLTNVSVEIVEDGRECWRINPALVSGQPSYLLRR